jgi:ubiquinone/menaquinone biosynthesis C-methylase UbiE
MYPRSRRVDRAAPPSVVRPPGPRDRADGAGYAAGTIREIGRAVAHAVSPSATREVAGQFDQISRVYDETREPLDDTSVEGIASELRSLEVASVLEVGVGTGRVATCLERRGFAVTGVDVSRGMLARARAKGLPRLVRGSVYHLPFASERKPFDAALFVHVLHLLEDPPGAVRAAAEVSRLRVLALVHPSRKEGTDASLIVEEPRRLLREAILEQGFPLPSSPNPWVKEREILAGFPPDELRVVSDKEITEPVRARIDRLSKRGQRNLLQVPPEILERAVRAARDRAGDRTITFHLVEALAAWDPGRWARAQPDRDPK